MHGITFLQTRLMQQGSIPTLSALGPPSFTQCHEKQPGNVW